MMRALLLGSVVAAWSLMPLPSFAASAETEAFVANVRLNSLFLQKASELAGDRSANADLRSFAASEAVAVAGVTSTLDARTAPAMAEQDLPITVASGDVITGRSAAVDRDVSAPDYSAPVGTGALMPAALITLDHLADSKGGAFDALYKATEVNALRQLAAFYNAYAMTGDDVALKQLAKSELRATNSRIADIARL